jgi:hypothetical protein
MFVGGNAKAVNSIKRFTVAAHRVKPARNSTHIYVSRRAGYTLTEQVET